MSVTFTGAALPGQADYPGGRTDPGAQRGRSTRGLIAGEIRPVQRGQERIREAAKLGFTTVMLPSANRPRHAIDDVKIFLSGPGASGSRAMPDCHRQEPGGWNRFAIEVADLAATVEPLRKAGARFRSDIIAGVGGRQILVEDPSGNPVELFEPTLPEARLEKRE